MAAKKKTTTPLTAAQLKVQKAQLAAFKNKPVTTAKPTAAFTNVGQKATGLRSLTPAEIAARKASEAKPKTPIKNAKSGFAGSGMPIGASFGVSNITKGDVANAVLAATLLPGSGQFKNYVAGKAGGKVIDAAFRASTKGFEASGAGGKVKTVMTPFGKTLGSTRIGSPAQQSASMNNLEIAKIKEAVRAGADIANQVIRGMSKTGKIVKVTTVAGVTGKAVVDKQKNKPKGK
jgi:hypothetical protein